jgi:hypothetical protein
MKKCKNQNFLNILRLLVCFQVIGLSKMFAGDIDILNERLNTYYLGKYAHWHNAEQYLPTQSSDGSWPDINYDDHWRKQEDIDLHL